MKALIRRCHILSAAAQRTVALATTPSFASTTSASPRVIIDIVPNWTKQPKVVVTTPLATVQAMTVVLKMRNEAGQGRWRRTYRTRQLFRTANR